MELTYDWSYGRLIKNLPDGDALMEECSALYSEHYGKWGQHAPENKIGKNVKLGPDMIKKWLESDNSSIYWAKDQDKLVGYAIAIQVSYPHYGTISWVTQLVVHKAYRNRGIAKAILLTIWGFSDDFAWGIVSANPYAIRALEKTTRRRAIPLRIKNNLTKLLTVGSDNVPYINKEIETLVDEITSQINTKFYIDHTNVPAMIQSVEKKEQPWNLGLLQEGWEWFAFTFKDQIPFELEKKEIEQILNTSDQVAQKAYERMDYTMQPWARNAEKEVSFIIRECSLRPGDTVIDFGCGNGRHAILLAEKGINVIAVDYVDRHIKEAQKKAAGKNLQNITFICDNCRDIDVGKAKAVLCLYDVIGSYVDDTSNRKILQNINYHLQSGGTAIISVMNYESTLARAKYSFSMQEQPNDLLKLPASTIQGKTGNIFDPDYYLLEKDHPGVVYRREQFRTGRPLPIELIVRDRRFTKDEISAMCVQAGLTVEYARYVNSKDWDICRQPAESAAKEILLKCRKKG